jgi:hypothetical protein
MNDPIEEALKRMKPSDMPDGLMARLTAARPQPAEKKPAFWLRWLMPLAAGATAAVMATMWLRHEPAVEKDAQPMIAAAKTSIPVERNDYLVAAREVGIVNVPNQTPFRVVEVEWLEQSTIRTAADGPAIRVETKRKDVVPVALEIF